MALVAAEEAKQMDSDSGSERRWPSSVILQVVRR